MANVKVSYICGVAGSGKTFLVRQKIEANPSYGRLSASTGIAAINLNTITVHSLLGFFNLDSLIDSYTTGKLLKKIRKVAEEGYQNIIIDELSMFSSDMLDIIYKAISEVNHMEGSDLGLIVIADFLQLPPVKAPFAFEAKCWPEFEANTTKLTKIWRQSDEGFINALNHARAGDGASCIEVLFNDCGLSLESNLDSKFKGTTIVAKNDQVDRFNWISLSQIKEPSFFTPRIIKGKPLREWEDKIPERSEYKVGAYVMLLANNYSYENGAAEIVYANGDCGVIREWNELDKTAEVELARTSEIVSVPMLRRVNSQRSKPEKEEIERIWKEYKYEVKQEKISGDLVWVLGEVNYIPMRLAYSSTTFKAQGLTLDQVQVDFRDHFFSHPGMLYVALSRARTAKGLRLVGSKDLFVKRCKLEEKVRRFI